MRQCSLDQGGGCLFTVSSLGASPVGLNYNSLLLPSVLLTAMADVTIDFVTYVIYETVKRLKRHLAIPPYRHTNIQQHSRYYTYQRDAEMYSDRSPTMPCNQELVANAEYLHDEEVRSDHSENNSISSFPSSITPPIREWVRPRDASIHCRSRRKTSMR
jgi:hypothetical protein